HEAFRHPVALEALGLASAVCAATDDDLATTTELGERRLCGRTIARIGLAIGYFDLNNQIGRHSFLQLPYCRPSGAPTISNAARMRACCSSIGARVAAWVKM